MVRKNERYIIDNFFAKSLENNPLNSPVKRDLRIYLPPKYYISADTRYPVIYFLHGYGGNNHNWSITANDESERALPIERIPKNLLDKIDLDKILTYEKLDELIMREELKPFILVQPDASLHVPNINETKNLQGDISTKGSFYLNSPFTGNYMDYITNDVIEHIDSNYKTIPDKNNRILIGASMGGAGALRICLRHPEKFIAAAALSSGNIIRELIDWEVLMPLIKELFGEKIAKRRGKRIWADILDTFDLVLTKDNPLLPSIQRDDKGKIINLNKEAFNNWLKYDINQVIKEYPNALKEIHLLINSDHRDEMGSAIATEGIHKTLEELGIPHQFELYEAPKAYLSPHILGIAYHILPAIRFGLQYIN